MPALDNNFINQFAGRIKNHSLLNGSQQDTTKN
jgi:hypothetical protein